jgi:hypothetical protein
LGILDHLGALLATPAADRPNEPSTAAGRQHAKELQAAPLQASLAKELQDD